MVSDRGKYKKGEKISFLAQIKNHKGLTLTEVLVMVGIIIIVTGIALVQLKNASHKAKLNKAEAEIEMMGRAMEQIEEDTENYLESLDQLDDVTSPDDSFSPWWGPYVSSLPVNSEDPWGTSYVYFFWTTGEEGEKKFQLGSYLSGSPGGGWEKGKKMGWGDASIPPGLWKKLGAQENLSEKGFLLFSAGPDRETGTNDDIEYGTY